MNLTLRIADIASGKPPRQFISHHGHASFEIIITVYKNIPS